MCARVSGKGFCGSVLGVFMCVSPKEELAQGQAPASAPLKAAIGLKQQPRPSPTPLIEILHPGIAEHLKG